MKTKAIKPRQGPKGSYSTYCNHCNAPGEVNKVKMHRLFWRKCPHCGTVTRCAVLSVMDAFS